ncbi:hypothetical protein [Streptomyces sp. NPDC054784]
MNEDDYCDECVTFGCRGHELCDTCAGEICHECDGCDCPNTACPGYPAHETGTDFSTEAQRPAE